MENGVIIMKLHTKIFIGLFAAILFGGIIQYLGFEAEQLTTLSILLNLVAQIFLRLLKMIVVPVVVSSLICGIVGEGKLGTLGKAGAPYNHFLFC